MVFRGCKRSGRSAEAAVSRYPEGKMEVRVKEQTFCVKEIFLVFRVRNEVGQSHLHQPG